jgi:guanylate kinase
MKLVTITGPSCSGKTTLVKELIRKYPDYYCKVVSFTTRSIRDGEVDGVDYHFISKEEALDSINSKQLAEYEVFNKNIYGTTLKEMSEKVSSGKIPLQVIEPTGLTSIRKLYPKEVYSVYMDLSLEELIERYLSRLYADTGQELSYAAARIVSISNEHKSWKDMGPYDFRISSFTSSNKESILTSLNEVLLMEKAIWLK